MEAPKVTTMPVMPSMGGFWQKNKLWIIGAIVLVVVVIGAILYRGRGRKSDEQDEILREMVQDQNPDENLNLPPHEHALATLEKRLQDVESMVNKFPKIREMDRRPDISGKDPSKAEKKETPATKSKVDPDIEKEAYFAAKKIGTIEAYEHFLAQDYPTKNYRGVATRLCNGLKKKAKG